MHQNLVLANRTLSSDRLLRFCIELAGTEPSAFRLLVPASTPTEAEVSWSNSEHPLRWAGESLAYTVAQARLTHAVEQWRAAGLSVDGTVGDPSPLRAVREELRGADFRRIIVSTLPLRISRWLMTDVPGRLRREQPIPVVHVGHRPTRAEARQQRHDAFALK